MKNIQGELIGKIKRRHSGVLIKILLVLSILSFSGISTVGNTYAAEGTTTVITTEKVPGANCTGTKKAEGSESFIEYECKVAKGFGSVIEMMGKMIKYFTYIAALGGVLFVVVNGILYSMGGADPSLKDDAKKRITGTLIGLVILFLSGVILNLIAPWIYK